MSFVDKLKVRWKLESTKQVWLALLVFALTGTTIALIKRPIIAYLFPEGVKPLWFQIAYWILILPVYNLVLLGYGTLFGLFDFFWSFEKRMFSRFLGRKQ